MGKSVPGQVWSTEVTVVCAKRQGMLGIRQHLQTRHDDVQIVPGMPGVVRQIADSMGLLQDGLAVDFGPWVIGSEEEVDRLVELICLPSRRLPVFVVSLEEGESDPRKAVLDVNRLAPRLFGIGHVAVIPGPLTYRLTDLVGQRFSVFRGAVRTYKPGCDIATDSPFNHPLALQEAIRNWGDSGPTAFIDLLTGTAAQQTLSWSDELALHR